MTASSPLDVSDESGGLLICCMRSALLLCKDLQTGEQIKTGEVSKKLQNIVNHKFLLIQFDKFLILHISKT